MMDSITPSPVVQAPGVKALDHAKAAQSAFLAIGIVGAVGSGTSWAARVLRRLLARRHVVAEVVTARRGLEAASGREWTDANARKETDPIGVAGALQAIGDKLRLSHDNAFVASGMIAQIAESRKSDAPPAVVICDSLRHPAEAHLLRMVYGDALWLLGTVCDLETRTGRLRKKFKAASGKPLDDAKLRAFIERDEDSPDKHGQHVAATFEIADYFVDTSHSLSDPEAPDTELDAWPVTDDLGRFLDLTRGPAHVAADRRRAGDVSCLRRAAG